MHLDEEWELKKKRKEFEWFTKTTEYSFCHFWLIGMLSYQIMLGDVLEKFTHGGNQERNKTALAVVANKKKHRHNPGKWKLSIPKTSSTTYTVPG